MAWGSSLVSLLPPLPPKVFSTYGPGDAVETKVIHAPLLAQNPPMAPDSLWVKVKGLTMAHKPLHNLTLLPLPVSATPLPLFSLLQPHTGLPVPVTHQKCSHLKAFALAAPGDCDRLSRMLRRMRAWHQLHPPLVFAQTSPSPAGLPGLPYLKWQFSPAFLRTSPALSTFQGAEYFAYLRFCTVHHLPPHPQSESSWEDRDLYLLHCRKTQHLQLRPAHSRCSHTAVA